MKRIGVLVKSFDDGSKKRVEFVKNDIGKNRMVFYDFKSDGSRNVIVYSNLDDSKLQTNIKMYKEMGYIES